MEASTTKKYLDIRTRLSRSPSPNHTIINGQLMGERACDNIFSAEISDDKGKSEPMQKNPVTRKEFSWLEFSSESSSSDNVSSISQHELLYGSSSNECLKSNSISETAQSETYNRYCPFGKKSLSHTDLMSKVWKSEDSNISNNTSSFISELQNSKNNNKTNITGLEKNKQSDNPDKLFEAKCIFNSEFPTIISPTKHEQFNWFSNIYLKKENIFETSDINGIDRCRASQCSFELKRKKSLSYGDLMNELYCNEEVDNCKIKKSSSMISLQRKYSCELLKSAESNRNNLQFINYLAKETRIRRKSGTRMGTSFRKEEEYKEWLKQKNWLQFDHRHISPSSRSSSIAESNYCAAKKLIKLQEQRLYPSWSILAVVCIVILFFWFDI